MAFYSRAYHSLNHLSLIRGVLKKTICDVSVHKVVSVNQIRTEELQEKISAKDAEISFLKEALTAKNKGIDQRNTVIAQQKRQLENVGEILAELRETYNQEVQKLSEEVKTRNFS